MSVGLLYLTMIIYTLVAFSEWKAGHGGLAVAFAGYVIGNIGLMLDVTGK